MLIANIMKNRYTLIIIVCFAFLVNFKTYSQQLCHGDTIHISVTGHSGNLQWQVSENLINWTNILGGYYDTLHVIAKANKYYRARVLTGTCNPFYSDTMNIIALACPCPNAPTVTDANGNVYPTVRLGTQCWMAKNLNTGTAQFNNVTLSTTSVQKYCYGATNTNADPFGNCAIHGGLYTWAAVMQGATTTDAVPSAIQGICPVGWHLPSDAEWKVMEYEIGVANPDLIGFRGTTQGTQLKDGGTANFNGLMSGKRDYTNEYKDMDTYGYFWTTTQSSSTNAWMRSLWVTSPSVGRFANHKLNAASVRCVKD